MFKWLVLPLIGLLLMVMAIVWQIIFSRIPCLQWHCGCAVIPFQEVTPAMAAGYERDGRIADVMLWTGLAVFILGVGVALCALIGRWLRR